MGPPHLELTRGTFLTTAYKNNYSSNSNIYLDGKYFIFFYFIALRSSGTTALIANQGQLTTGSVTTAIQQSTGRRRKTKNQSQISAGKSSKFYFKNVLFMYTSIHQ